MGVSVGTVQALLERGDLRGWKTQGGHRRIECESVKRYQRNVAFHSEKSIQGGVLRILVVDSDLAILNHIEESCAKWKINLECSLLPSAIEALLCISKLRPHVLFSDLSMPDIDGFEFLKTLQSSPQYDAMHCVAVSNMSQAEIAERGGVPPKVMLLKKPLDMWWLHGFVTALMAEKESNAAKHIYLK